MNKWQHLICLATTMMVALPASAQNNELNWTMERAVRQLDRQGSDLESVLAEADVSWSGGSPGAHSLPNGRIYFNERGEFRLSGDEPGKLVVLMDGSSVHYYDPAGSRADEYRLSQHADRLEAYIPLGFSTTGKDLERDFLVTFIGEQTIGDRRVLGLELTPEDDRLRAVVARIEIWFDEASWLPARQIISRSGGGVTLTIDYSGTARNLDLNPELFDDDWPRGTEKNTVRE